jgi:hypothetical protein
MAEIWFELDTGQDPDWRMMSSRPAIAGRGGPTFAGPAAGAERTAPLQLKTSRDLLRAYSMLKGSERFTGRAREAVS